MKAKPLSRQFLLVSHRPGPARGTFASVAKLANINLQFTDSAAERVAVHSKLAGGAALVALVLFKHGGYEASLEFAHCLGIKDVALVHLLYECFQLIFHGISLFVAQTPPFKNSPRYYLRES